MASEAQDEERSLKKRKRTGLESGPFVLRTLLQDVPLSADGANDGDIKINCVDYLGAHGVEMKMLPKVAIEWNLLTSVHVKMATYM
jgi:hypothetical protein